MVPRLVIIADIKNWAFDIVANNMKKCLADNFQVDIIYSNDEKYHKDLYTILEDAKGYDIIHVLWRKLLLQFDLKEFRDKVINAGYNFEEYIGNIRGKVSTAVYDHMFLEQEDINKYANVFNRYSSQYYTSSNKLLDIYSEINEYASPFSVIMDATDIDIFVPKNIERFEYQNIKDREIIIGWVGNSNWNYNNEEKIDYKGYHTIFKKAIEELVKEGYDIRMYCADRNEKWIPRNEMPEYYKEIDVYICTSLMEGTPNPVLEAMATGVPVITTDVGIVNDILGKEQQNFIINERSIQAIKDKVKYLYNNRELFEILSKENIEESKKHHYIERKQNIIDFFNAVVEKMKGLKNE